MLQALDHRQKFAGALQSGWRAYNITAGAQTGVRSVNDPAAINVAQIILSGAHRHPSDGATAMPSFGAAYSDAEIASLANYVTARFGAAPSALTAQNVAALREQD